MWKHPKPQPSQQFRQKDILAIRQNTQFPAVEDSFDTAVNSWKRTTSLIKIHAVGLDPAN